MVALSSVQLSNLHQAWCLIVSALARSESIVAKSVRLKKKDELAKELELLIASAKFSFDGNSRMKLPMLVKKIHDVVSGMKNVCPEKSDHQTDDGRGDHQVQDAEADTSNPHEDVHEVACQTIDGTLRQIPQREELLEIAERQKDCSGYYPWSKMIFPAWKEHGLTTDQCRYLKRHIQNSIAKEKKQERTPRVAPELGPEHPPIAPSETQTPDAELFHDSHAPAVGDEQAGLTSNRARQQSIQVVDCIDYNQVCSEFCHARVRNVCRLFEKRRAHCL